MTCFYKQGVKVQKQAWRRRFPARHRVCSSVRLFHRNEQVVAIACDGMQERCPAAVNLKNVYKTLNHWPYLYNGAMIIAPLALTAQPGSKSGIAAAFKYHNNKVLTIRPCGVNAHARSNVRIVDIYEHFRDCGAEATWWPSDT